MENEFNYTDLNQVNDFLAEQSDRNDMIASYALEYSGDEEGRKLRKLQIGHRKAFVQGKEQIQPVKLPVDYQSKIVETAVSFLFGDAPTINANDAENQQATEILLTCRRAMAPGARVITVVTGKKSLSAKGRTYCIAMPNAAPRMELASASRSI